MYDILLSFREQENNIDFWHIYILQVEGILVLSLLAIPLPPTHAPTDSSVINQTF